jgi:hypothetical protein
MLLRALVFLNQAPPHGFFKTKRRHRTVFSKLLNYRRCATLNDPCGTERMAKRGIFVAKINMVQANYINALAVSVSPFFEPATVTLGGLIFSPWVDFL